MNAHSLVVGSCVLALSTALPVAADVVRVGPGQPFRDLQPAVDAALPGDVLLVDSGQYSGFTIASKELSIVAERGATVDVAGAVTVRDLAAGRLVLLQGLTIEGTTSATGLELRSSMGSIRCENLVVRGGPGNVFFSAPGLPVLIDDCSDVAIAGCMVEGLEFLSVFTSTTGGPGIDVRGSSVALFTSTVAGGQGGPATSFFGMDGGPGVQLTDSFLFVSGSTIAGGRGGKGRGCLLGQPGGPGGKGGPGVLVDTTSAIERLDTVLAGGPGGPGGNASPPGSFDPCSGGPQGPTGIDTIVTGGTINDLRDTSREFDFPSPTRVGEHVTLAFRGAPNDLVALVYQLAPTYQFDASLHGALLVDLGGVLFLPIGRLSAGGTTTFSFTQVPMGPGVEELTFVSQPVFVNTQGEAYVGTQATAVLLDASF